MDMTYIEVISTVGFPIFSALGLAWFVKTNSDSYREDSKEREEHYRQHQKEMVVEMGKISATIDRINDRLEDIEKRVYDKK